jgi:hypothetical protein
MYDVSNRFRTHIFLLASSNKITRQVSSMPCALKKKSQLVGNENEKKRFFILFVEAQSEVKSTQIPGDCRLKKKQKQPIYEKGT